MEVVRIRPFSVLVRFGERDKERETGEVNSVAYLD